MKRYWIAVGLVAGACAMPGAADLAANGITRSFHLRGEPGPLASCLTTALDQEEWRLGAPTTPVTRSRPIEPGGGVELVGGYSTDPTVLIWRAEFQPEGEGQTSVMLTTRKVAALGWSGQSVGAKIQHFLGDCARR